MATVVLQDLNFLPPKERDVAMVFQNYALYPHYRVEQRMNFSMRTPSARVRAGNTVEPEIDLSAAYFFDAADGTAIPAADRAAVPAAA